MRASSTEVLDHVFADAEAEAKELEQRVAEIRDVFDEATKQLDIRKTRLKECDGEIAAVVAEKDSLAKQLADCIVERKRTEHK